MNLRLVICFLVIVAPLQAQDMSGGRLTIRTDPPGADVYLDSTKVGLSPFDRIPVPIGTYRLSLFYPSSTEWNSLVRRETLTVHDGEEIEKVIEFGSLVSLASSPSGSRVIAQGKELGTTPIFFRSASTLSGGLFLEKEGFSRTAVPLSDGMAAAFVRLSRSGAGEGNDDLILRDPDSNGSRRWAVYLSAAGMVTSGIIAAYFKERANNRFEVYLQTRNPSYLASTRRNDRRSAVAFLLTQIGFGLVTYFLLSE